MATVTKTVTLIPSGNTTPTNMSNSSSYPASRGYNDTTNTSYARFSITASRTGTVYYTFNTSTIPNNATITSVTAKARCYVSSTTRVTNTQCMLCSGTTTKGTNVTFASTSNQNIVTLNPGSSWTRSDLNDLRILLGGTATSSSSSKYIWFAGAEVVITYTVPAYTISVTGDGTFSPSSDTVEGGGSCTITISDVSSPTVTDNNVDVTSQLVPSGSSYTYSLTNIQADHAIVVSDSVPLDPPTITIGTPSRVVISDETGYDQCVCTFTSDQRLVQWEARATRPGIVPGHGVGLLVESGSALNVGATGTVTIDNEELTQGDGEYTITVYGQNAGGIWSDEDGLTEAFIPVNSTGLMTSDSARFVVMKEV